ncbi:enoyl-CoA hydratase/isomerase family protein [Xanthobacter sp. KR7-225]|uniref:enoyl-CoA hydratase/isomerase family protein n=1 Tax=Xanthobacter sp. KR7-225 TaxID=3156613 RepID=UPI0032B48935
MSDVLTLERAPPAAVLTFNRPDKQNALNLAMFDALDDAFDALDREGDIRGVVLTGTPNVFSTGGDLKQALEINTILETKFWLDRFAATNARIEALTKPVVAAIHGWCLTGGLELALCCDIRIAATTAQFGVTSSRIGTVAGAGATQRLARLIGPEWTKQMLFSGDFIDAQTALRIGLVSEVVEPDAVVPAATARIAAYAQRAPLSVYYAKLAVNNGLQMDLQSALAYERQLTTGLFATADRKEGMAAFLGKRKPHFKGE